MKYQRQALQKLRGHWLALIALLFVSKCLGSLLMELLTGGNSLFMTVLSALLSVFVIAILTLSFNFGAWRVAKNDYPTLNLIFAGFKRDYYAVLVELSFIQMIVMELVTLLATLAYVPKLGITKVIQYNVNTGSLLMQVLQQISNGKINPTLLSFTMLMSVVMLLLSLFVGAYFDILFFAKIAHPQWTLRDVFVNTNRALRGKFKQLLWLQITFIPWYLTSILTLSLSLIFVAPFNQVALAVFYEEL
ncbi:MAG: DUF975 family protein [Candidatus Paralactobacillus gallistercoris]|uniref:DUF975 family protein n=1 Tax=Candidatus Paralactobacillus gallistercoris TaxID=2838724 RepID=A0A948X0H9_9LACO|nr:DUF975 family protein [Candidatus Paralactobacillus gallistercoris]